MKYDGKLILWHFKNGENPSFSGFVSKQRGVNEYYWFPRLEQALNMELKKKRIIITAHDRPAKNRKECYIKWIKYNCCYIRFIENNYVLGMHVSELHKLGIEPEEDTYFWLEIKQ